MRKQILLFHIFIIMLYSLGACQKTDVWIRHNDNNNSIPKTSTNMIIDQNGNLWLASYGKDVYRYNLVTQQWSVDFDVRENGLRGGVETLAFGSNNDLWIGAETGLGRYQFDTKQWTIYTRQDGLDNEDIRAILIDHEGNIWVGTGGGGVFLSKDMGNSWQQIIIEEAFSDFTVLDIYQDSRNHIWIAGDALYRFNPVSQIWSTFTDGGDRLNSLTNEWETSPSETDILPDDFIYSILEDEDGTLWFGTLSAGVLWYDPDLEQWGQFTNEDGLVNNTVKAINIDARGNFWFGTDGGVSRFNSELNEWTTFNKENGFTNHSTSSIVVDNQGRLWFATFGDGVFMFDPNK